MKEIAGQRRRVPAGWWFALAFVLMCSVHEYGRVLHKRPQPHHIWRQTISLSITRNYHDGDLHFLDSQVNNLYLDHGWSGKAAAEFPLLYYAVAKLWKITGRSEFAYRIVMLMVHFLGALALFRVLRSALLHDLLAAILALLFLSSPAVVYFTLGFIMEVPALDLLMIGASLLLLHRSRGDMASLAGACAFFALAGLSKVTALMVPVALIAALFAEMIFLERVARLGHLFTRQRWLALCLLISACVIVWIWYAYTLRYNELHHGSFSNQDVQPPWRMSGPDFERAWRFGSTLLPGMVYHWSLWLVLGVCMAHLGWCLRALPIGLLTFNITLSCGTVLFVILFFPALNQHDYYFIVPLVLPWALTGSSLWLLARQRPGLVGSKVFLTVAGGLALLNIAYAREDHEMRTREVAALASVGTFPLHSDEQRTYWQESQYWSLSPLLDIEPYARQLGIRAQDTVICVPDNSVCAALYLCGQRGWQNFGTLNNLEDSASLAFYRDRGARYLFVLEGSWLERPYMRAFTRHRIGAHRGVNIYDLRDGP